MNIDALINDRKEARERKDFATADTIRSRLLAVNVIVTDTKEGQEVVMLGRGTTVEAYLKKQEADRRANARFEAWLYSVRSGRGT